MPPYSREAYKKRKPGQLLSLTKCHERIAVKDQAQSNYDYDDGDDVTYCEICHRSDREDRMLLCDGCDLGFHCECLTPPIENIPEGAWYCDACALISTDESSDEDVEVDESALDDADIVVNESELNDLIADSAVRNERPASRRLRSDYRQIARTRFSERIVRRINTTRRQRGVVMEESESEDDDDYDDDTDFSDESEVLYQLGDGEFDVG